MAQVQVFTNGKWVGAGSQTVDPSNCIDLLINPAFFGANAPLQSGCKPQYRRTIAGCYTHAPEDLATAVVSSADPVPTYTMTGRIASFPDGTKVICYGYYQPNTSGSPLSDLQDVFLIGIPAADVNADTKIEMVWYPHAYGEAYDYIGGVVDGGLRYAFNMKRLSNPAGTPQYPKASSIAFFSVDWKMIRDALHLVPTAWAGRFLGYAGGPESQTVQFRKTILA